MKTYWITFRLKQDATYEERYNRLYEAVRQLADGNHWVEPTSFIAFESDKSVTTLAREFAAVISLSKDVILLSAFEFKICRIIGHLEDRDILQMVPFAKYD